MSSASITQAALEDLQIAYDYLLSNANPPVADRFASGVDATFQLLVAQPRIGRAIDNESAERVPDLRNLRKWRVKDFDNYLVLYKAEADGVTIVRVVHGASDWLRGLPG